MFEDNCQGPIRGNVMEQFLYTVCLLYTDFENQDFPEKAIKGHSSPIRDHPWTQIELQKHSRVFEHKIIIYNTRRSFPR